jgi:uncharacterized repeat protein (TIGR03803 family)
MDGANGPDGTVFKITPGGALTTLYSFCSQPNCTDGANPFGGLVTGADGNFYGTTDAGGSNPSCGNFYCQVGCGTVFKITASGEFTTLHSFCSESGCADGSKPLSDLVAAANGNFYGTASGAGTSQYGTVFSITLGGDFTTLYTFCSKPSCTDGANPYAPLLQVTNGDFYGTTLNGGSDDIGTIFSLSVGLDPFVKVQPAFGNRGAAVEILGSDLTGTTSVTFNGTPAAFTVVRSSEIVATVPAGATSGMVRVATPGGTLSSNVPFRVP